MMTRMACPGTTSAIANSTWGDLLIVTHQPMSVIRETVTHFETSCFSFDKTLIRFCKFSQ